MTGIKQEPENFDPTPNQEDVEDLVSRLNQTRFPPQQPTDDWSAGTPISFARELVHSWATEFDFEKYAAELRELPHFRLQIDGAWTHFIHVRSPHQNARPIIITHGWPSSFLEMIPLIDRLTQPEKYGGRAEEAFNVVVPSMPGFAYSDALTSMDQMTAASIADRWWTLMNHLGYEKFFAAGADIGARVTAWLAVRHPEAVLGAHMSTNALSPVRTPGVHDGPLQPDEETWLKQMAAWSESDGAYHHLQGTKPITVALACSDSPVALAAWVAEKWQAWSSLDLQSPAGKKILLSLVTLYWTTGSFGSSVFHYYAHDLAPGSRPLGVPDTPAMAFYACETDDGGVPPRSLAQRQYQVARWTVFPRGGHFMAIEEPDLLAADIREFASGL